MEEIIARGLRPEDLFNALNDVIARAKENAKAKSLKRIELITKLRGFETIDTDLIEALVEAIESEEIPYLRINYGQK